jgi:mannose-6-phosphate isomerase-like protein (cupin superfamily)
VNRLMIANENHPEMKIISASCEITGAGNFDRGIARILVLPGEIVGVKTYFAELRGGMANKCLPEENEQRILIFTDGTGNIRQDGHSFAIDELSLFVPDHHREFFISSGKENLSYLEIVLHLAAEDLLWLGEREDKFPYFIRYAECREYVDDIKSGKTVSRIILPEDIVPRLCIGSVQTSGPDEVEAHTHPMLEQLFFGLLGNDVVVKADSVEARFLEKDLLHIPLGSSHGVRVGTGNDLHYIWIDIFHSLEDIDYIKNNHFLKEE